MNFPWPANKHCLRSAFFLGCCFYKERIMTYHPVYTFVSDKCIPGIANREQKDEFRKTIIKKEFFQ